MKSFRGGLAQRPVSQTVLRSVRLLGEFKGRQALYAQQTPQTLDALRQVAAIQSTESSNRIEGVVASHARIQQLVSKNATPANRHEQEIAGYRDVLQTIHSSHEHIGFTPGVVRQLHGDLFKYTAVDGGQWKRADNEIIERAQDGTLVVRFQPVQSWATPGAMDELHQLFGAAWSAEESEPLVLIAAYVLDFLCIHPFLDGNGRMSRLLTLLMLYRAGYTVGRYIGLEKIVEDNNESYYQALALSSRGWHEGEHDLEPWTQYLLGTLIAAYRDFEARIGSHSSPRGTKSEMVLAAFERLPTTFRIVDLERVCPTVGRETIRVVLGRLKTEDRVVAIGRGPAARWQKK